MHAQPRPDDKTDQAALFGAAFAAIITISIGEGPWQSSASVFGVVLLFVILAYYRPLHVTGGFDAAMKSCAFAAVTALVTFMLMAWPIQELFIRPSNPWHGPYSDKFADYCSGLDLNTTAGYEDCLGRVTSGLTVPVWLGLFAILTVGWWVWAGHAKAPGKPDTTLLLSLAARADEHVNTKLSDPENMPAAGSQTLPDRHGPTPTQEEPDLKNREPAD